jgi:hypothetical protein
VKWSELKELSLHYGTRNGSENGPKVREEQALHYVANLEKKDRNGNFDFRICHSVIEPALLSKPWKILSHGGWT